MSIHQLGIWDRGKPNVGESRALAAAFLCLGRDYLGLGLDVAVKRAAPPSPGPHSHELVG